MKTLKDEWYIVIKAFKLLFLRFFYHRILRVCTIPTYRVYQLYYKCTWRPMQVEITRWASHCKDNSPHKSTDICNGFLSFVHLLWVPKHYLWKLFNHFSRSVSGQYIPLGDGILLLIYKSREETQCKLYTQESIQKCTHKCHRYVKLPSSRTHTAPISMVYLAKLMDDHDKSATFNSMVWIHTGALRHLPNK